MNILEIESAQNHLDIEDETGEKIGLRLFLQPLSCPDAQRILKKNRREQMEALRKNKDTTAMQERQGQELLAVCITGWKWSENPQLTTRQGKVVPLTPIDYSPENALALVSTKNIKFIADAIDKYLGDESNFY